MKKQAGQATIEFTFAMVIVALLIFGLMSIFRWTGMDYAQTTFMIQNTAVFKPWTANMQDERRQQRMSAYTQTY
jgi:hypothetical protein